MSGPIIGEVFRYAPADLTDSERLVLLALAEDARSDRVARYSSVERLAQYTGKSPGTVRNALSALAARALIQRVGAAKAHRGRIQHYRLAQLAAHHQAALHVVPDLDPKSHPGVTLSDPESVTGP
ncbi:MAG TPA: helix-turn-helix domain-containing protein [Acidimicrobiales bacterium]|nr:helix-turn-helix domain-containing protein [Acidimicrobiales bacterium]